MYEVDPESNPVEAIRGQSTRIRLGSLLVIALSLLAHVLISKQDTSYAFVEQLAGMILDALMIAGMAAFLSETRFFRNHMEERLNKFGLIERATNPSVLRRFSRETLERIERAAQEAVFPIEMPSEWLKLVSTLNGLRDKLILWRGDYRVDLNYVEMPEKPKYYRMVEELKFEYVNCTGQVQRLDQSFGWTGLPAPESDGITDYEMTLLEVDGKNVLPSPMPPSELDGMRRTWSIMIPMRIPPRQASGRSVTVKSQGYEVSPIYRPWVLTFFIPVHGIKISLQHPTAVVPRLYIFGIGGRAQETDPLSPTTTRDGYKYWEYDGWLLPSHGVVLTFGGA